MCHMSVSATARRSCSPKRGTMMCFLLLITAENSRSTTARSIGQTRTTHRGSDAYGYFEQYCCSVWAQIITRPAHIQASDAEATLWREQTNEESLNVCE